MKALAVEVWAPDHGAAVDAGALGDAQAVTDLGREVPVDRWRPLDPSPTTPPVSEIAFVDGVRRVDARAWITGDDETVVPGLCASYAAGVVRVNGRASIVDAEVRRSVFSPATGLQPIDTRHGRYSAQIASDPSNDALSLALQSAMGDLEHHVSLRSSDAGDDGSRLLVVDGPLRERRLLPGAVGYVKTHHVSYLPSTVAAVLGDLRAGQRTPILSIGDRFRRWSWYLRLPGEVSHPWACIVRCEASPDHSIEDVARLADQTAQHLPRFASAPHKDARAPQNLYPIAGLERELRRRLGDPKLLYRALRTAAVQP